MAVDATGNWGQPGFLDGGAPDIAVDPTAVSDYFAPMVPRRFTTLASLLAATPPAAGYSAKADNAPGATWIHNGSSWVMYGIPRFADATARDAVITAPAAGMEVYLGTVRYLYTTAWVRLSGLYAALTKSADQTLTTGGNEYAVTFDGELSDIGAMHDNAVNNSRITVPIAGIWEASYSLYEALTSGSGYAYLRKNGLTPLLGSVDRRAGSTTGIPLRNTLLVALAAADYVEVMASASAGATLVKGPNNAGVAIESFGATASLRYVGPVS